MSGWQNSKALGHVLGRADSVFFSVDGKPVWVSGRPEANCGVPLAVWHCLSGGQNSRNN